MECGSYHANLIIDGWISDQFQGTRNKILFRH